MSFPTPTPDTVEQTRRAIRKVENDEKRRALTRLRMARDGCLMVGPGYW